MVVEAEAEAEVSEAGTMQAREGVKVRMEGIMESRSIVWLWKGSFLFEHCVSPRLWPLATLFDDNDDHGDDGDDEDGMEWQMDGGDPSQETVFDDGAPALLFVSFRQMEPIPEIVILGRTRSDQQTKPAQTRPRERCLRRQANSKHTKPNSDGRIGGWADGRGSMGRLADRAGSAVQL